MAEWICQHQMCSEKASMHFSEVTNNHSKETDLCLSHGNELIAEHQQEFGDPTAINRNGSTESINIECFVHFLFLYPVFEPPYGYVELRENLGIRVFGFTVDLYSASEIHRALTKLKLPRPHPHDVLLEVINCFQGIFREVKLYQLPVEQATFGASVNILRMEEKFAVDMRASDAIALAMLDDKPIFVPEALLVGK